MTATLATILPSLAFLASTAGAGWAASRIFDAARRRVRRPTRQQWPALTPLGRLVVAALYAPRGARLTVFALAALISVACSALLAALTAQPLAPALDAALAIIASQVVHAAALPAAATPREAA